MQHRDGVTVQGGFHGNGPRGGGGGGGGGGGKGGSVD